MRALLRPPRAATLAAVRTTVRSPRAHACAAAAAQHPAAAVVVGGGVTGLTCAVRLLELGYAVTLLARERPERTVSLGAGAIWEYPPFKVSPAAQACDWALASRDVFEALHAVETGTRLLRVHYLYKDAAAAPASRLAPAHAHLLRGFRSRVVPPEVSPAFSTGWSHVAPIVDMPTYLPWLERLVTALGGTLRWGVSASSLADARGDAPLVVNCAALGAAQLCGDGALTPVRGIKVYVRCAGVTDVYAQEPRDAEMPYFTTVTPRARAGEVALSGIVQPGAMSLTVTDEEVAEILRRCSALLPTLRGAPVVGTWAGLRPLRAADAGGVRLEAEEIDGATVVHNYGHGGAGVVTSWGCAADVARHAATAAARRGLLLQPRALPAAVAAGLPPLQQQRM